MIINAKEELMRVLEDNHKSIVDIDIAVLKINLNGNKTVSLYENGKIPYLLDDLDFFYNNEENKDPVIDGVILFDDDDYIVRELTKGYEKMLFDGKSIIKEDTFYESWSYRVKINRNFVKCLYRQYLE